MRVSDQGEVVDAYIKRINDHIRATNAFIGRATQVCEETAARLSRIDHHFALRLAPRVLYLVPQQKIA